jgi:hypothetical protein
MAADARRAWRQRAAEAGAREMKERLDRLIAKSIELSRRREEEIQEMRDRGEL